MLMERAGFAGVYKVFVLFPAIKNNNSSQPGNCSRLAGRGKSELLRTGCRVTPGVPE